MIAADALRVLSSWALVVALFGAAALAWVWRR